MQQVSYYTVFYDRSCSLSYDELGMKKFRCQTGTVVRLLLEYFQVYKTL